MRQNVGTRVYAETEHEMSAHPSLGEAVVQLLGARGIEVCFGIPGTHNLEFYRGFSSAKSTVKHVLVRHEQSAGYAADAYFRVAGKPACVIATSGPGLANTLVAAGTAYADRIPMLVLSPGPELDRAGSEDGWLHYTKDQHGMANAVFGRSVRAETAVGALEAVDSAFQEWSARKHSLPIHVEIPADLLSAPVPLSVLAPLLKSVNCCGGEGVLPERNIEQLVQQLSGASTVGMLVGRGCNDARAEVNALAVTLGALAVETPDAKGVLSEKWVGCLGANTDSKDVMSAIFASDAVLVLGSELPRSMVALPAQEPSGLLVRVGSTYLEQFGNRTPKVALACDVQDFASRLIERFPGPSKERMRALDFEATRLRKSIKDGAPKDVRAVVELLAGLVTADPVIVGDSSQVCYRGIGPLLDGIQPKSYINSFGYSTLGYGVPGALGASIADPARPVICVTGEGALMFSVAELLTLVELKIPVAVVVVDNGGFREIREGMESREIAPVGVDFCVPDMGSLVRGLGARFVDFSAGSAEAFRDLVRSAWARQGPTVIRIEA